MTASRDSVNTHNSRSGIYCQKQSAHVRTHTRGLYQLVEKTKQEITPRLALVYTLLLKKTQINLVIRWICTNFALRNAE